MSYLSWQGRESWGSAFRGMEFFLFHLKRILLKLITPKYNIFQKKIQADWNGVVFTYNKEDDLIRPYSKEIPLVLY